VRAIRTHSWHVRVLNYSARAFDHALVRSTRCRKRPAGCSGHRMPSQANRIDELFDHVCRGRGAIGLLRYLAKAETIARPRVGILASTGGRKGKRADREIALTLRTHCAMVIAVIAAGGNWHPTAIVCIPRAHPSAKRDPRRSGRICTRKMRRVPATGRVFSRSRSANEKLKVFASTASEKRRARKRELRANSE